MILVNIGPIIVHDDYFTKTCCKLNALSFSGRMATYCNLRPCTSFQPRYIERFEFHTGIRASYKFIYFS